MKEYLTAKEAREMASKWQEVQIDFYIQRAIDAIKESANKGYYSKSFEAPPMNVSRKDCKKNSRRIRIYNYRKRRLLEY